MKYMPTVKCPHCGTEFSAMLAECPHCGKRRTRETDKEFAIRPEAEAAPAEKQPPVEKPKRKAPAWQSVLGVLLVVIGLVAAGLACFALGQEQSARAAATPEPTLTPAPTPTPTPTVNGLALYAFGRLLDEGFTAYVGDTVTVTVKSEPELPQASFDWSVSDGESLRLVVSKDTASCEVTVLKPSGKNELTVRCYGAELTIPVFLWERG